MWPFASCPRVRANLHDTQWRGETVAIKVIDLEQVWLDRDPLEGRGLDARRVARARAGDDRQRELVFARGGDLGPGNMGSGG